MTNFNFENFDNLDPTDFNEPTLETKQRFNRVIDKLKQIAIQDTFEPSSMLEIGDSFSNYGLTEDDLCPVTKYRYETYDDIELLDEDETYLKFILVDGNPEKFQNWKHIVGRRFFNSIYYQDSTIDINFRNSFYLEELYISKPILTESDSSPETIQQLIQQKKQAYLEAALNGSTIPTEGGYKKLIAVLEKEAQKRSV